ncbi:hypothetical protein F8388_020666 [Cannabis sativa]|uniref:Uncharacterized protein n=1 Tax=Cannabis sativa TaxID=3483 RepID=A0A7J6F2J7_CANSA|nr:hypothetical protein F8388_018264 [Cannabis sativa]KAF4364952.1 hypothetical protein F8388_020666 [Cannabis sativa]
MVMVRKIKCGTLMSTNPIAWTKSFEKRILRQTEEFQADDVYGGGGNDEYRTSFTEREARTIKKSKTVLIDEFLSMAGNLRWSSSLDVGL